MQKRSDRLVSFLVFCGRKCYFVLLLLVVGWLFTVQLPAFAQESPPANSFVFSGLTFDYIPPENIFSLFSLSTFSSVLASTSSAVTIATSSGQFTSLISASQSATVTSSDDKQIEIVSNPDPTVSFAFVTPTPTEIPPTPTPTSTPIPTPTATPIPPSPTPTVTPTPAPQVVAQNDPNSDAVWDRLAGCESNGHWNDDTGNGYYGGLQFSMGAWNSVGGTGNPAQASREDQIAKGKLLQAARGWSPWGACAKKLGLD